MLRDSRTGEDRTLLKFGYVPDEPRGTRDFVFCSSWFSLPRANVLLLIPPLFVARTFITPVGRMEAPFLICSYGLTTLEPVVENGDHLRTFRLASRYQRRDCENMHPATYAEANPLARRQRERRDFLIHVRHCTSIRTHSELERPLFFGLPVLCAVNYRAAFCASGTRMIFFAPDVNKARKHYRML